MELTLSSNFSNIGCLSNVTWIPASNPFPDKRWYLSLVVTFSIIADLPEKFSSRMETYEYDTMNHLSFICHIEVEYKKQMI